MKLTLKLLILFMAAGVFALVSSGYVFEDVSAQKSGGYGVFSHSVKEHKKSCSACHKVPSGNWKSAGNYPDITDYPGHESCVSCHRPEFFKGNRPEICTICHVESSPRGKARLRFPMRNRSQEFRTNFPHNVHQDIIAQNQEETLVRPSHTINVAYAVSFYDDDKKPQFNNCAICHQTSSRLPDYSATKPSRTEQLAMPERDGFAPTSEFFKNSPNSHASCFNCHFQSQRPTANDCASCHLLTPAHFESNMIMRYSLKFNHESENHNNKDCTTCHIRITQSSDLSTLMGADVPLMACSTSSCHAREIKDEITKRDDSVEKKQPVFQCNYCHSTAIGSYRVPVSHQDVK